MTNKFRNKSNTRYLKGLFFEECFGDKSSVLYTLKDEDHLGYPSLYRLYMESPDPTEYEFANDHLDGWDHWTMLCNCSWFQPIVERWRKEREVRDLSANITRMRDIADSTTHQSAFTALKFLIDRPWIKSTKGRPSKEDVRKEAQKVAENSRIVSEDAKRLQIN